MIRRTFLAILTLTATLGLAGCDSMDWISDMDPFGVNKKTPLPGERKPVFPTGVPGVTQGVPPDLMKGNQQAAVSDPVAQAPAAKPTEAEKPKPKRASRRARPPVQTAEPAAEPEPKAKPARSRAARARATEPRDDDVWPPPPKRGAPVAGNTAWPAPQQAAPVQPAPAEAAPRPSAASSGGDKVWPAPAQPAADTSVWSTIPTR